jgi:hypothetical protein
VSSAQIAVAATLAIAIAALFLLIILGIPLMARLLFTKRMEIIRDDCVDAILNDKLRETQSVERFIRVVETGTEISRRLTLPRIFAVARAAVDIGIDIKSMTRAPKYTDLVPSERHLMQELDSRLCAAYVSYLTWGSPAALILKPFLAIASRVHHNSEMVKAEDALPAVARETLRAGAVQSSVLVPRRLFMAGNHPRNAG